MQNYIPPWGGRKISNKKNIKLAILFCFFFFFFFETLLGFSLAETTEIFPWNKTVYLYLMGELFLSLCYERTFLTLLV